MIQQVEQALHGGQHCHLGDPVVSNSCVALCMQKVWCKNVDGKLIYEYLKSVMMG